MSEYLRKTLRLGDGKATLSGPEFSGFLAGRVTVRIRWNKPGRNEFRYALGRLQLTATEVHRHGEERAGIPRAVSFSVSGPMFRLEELISLRCVEAVEFSERAVPRSGTGTGEEKPRPKSNAYTPCLPITPLTV
jgi:hypothetical protein